MHPDAEYHHMIAVERELIEIRVLLQSIFNLMQENKERGKQNDSDQS